MTGERSTYTIRPFRGADASALVAIRRAAIAVIGPKRYDGAQVAAWLSRVGPAALWSERIERGAMIFVAADVDDRAVAYALLERDGHLDHLYNHPDHTRRGLTHRLLLHAEGCALALETERVFTEASEIARPVFERAGYRVTHRRDFAIEGVPIHNYAMEKALRPGAQRIR